MRIWIDRYCRGIELLMAAALAVMVVLVFGNVVLRYGFNSGITVSEELSRWLFVWMTFLGAVAALKDHGHLGTDMLVARLGPLGKKICLGLSYSLMLFICALLWKGTWAQFVINWSSTSAVMEASMAWIYAPGLVFALLGGLIIARQLLRLLSGQASEKDLVMVRESEDIEPAPSEEKRP